MTEKLFCYGVEIMRTRTPCRELFSLWLVGRECAKGIEMLQPSETIRNSGGCRIIGLTEYGMAEGELA